LVDDKERLTVGTQNLSRVAERIGASADDHAILVLYRFGAFYELKASLLF